MRNRRHLKDRPEHLKRYTIRYKRSTKIKIINHTNHPISDMHSRHSKASVSERYTNTYKPSINKRTTESQGESEGMRSAECEDRLMTGRPVPVGRQPAAPPKTTYTHRRWLSLIKMDGSPKVQHARSYTVGNDPTFVFSHALRRSTSLSCILLAAYAKSQFD